LLRRTILDQDLELIAEQLASNDMQMTREHARGAGTLPARWFAHDARANSHLDRSSFGRLAEGKPGHPQANRRVMWTGAQSVKAQFGRPEREQGRRWERRTGGECHLSKIPMTEWSDARRTPDRSK
jgi:hypothetical protein